MNKFKVDDRVVIVSGSLLNGRSGTISEIRLTSPDYFCRVKVDVYDNLLLWVNADGLKHEGLTVEQLNTEYMRRDGVIFEVFYVDDKIYGRTKTNSGEWIPVCWELNGCYLDDESGGDLIKKPVVREWAVEQTTYFQDGCNRIFPAQVINYLKQEGRNDPVLVRVEVVK